MPSYYELMKQARTPRLGKPIDTSHSVMDPEAPTMEKLSRILEVADIASNAFPGTAMAKSILGGGKAALMGMGGMIKYKKAASYADDAAAEALDMIGKKKPTSMIWTDTNSYLSPDGFIRQETPDLGAMIRSKNLSGIVQQGPDKLPFIKAKLGEGLDHPALFNDYPEIANMELLVKPRAPGSNTSALYSPRNNRVEVYPMFDATVEQGKISLDDVLHEIQHKVQHLEGFPQQGGSVSGYRATLEALERAKKTKAPMKYKFDPQTGQMLGDIRQEVGVRGADTYGAYRDLLGEAEARMTEARSMMREPSRTGISPISTMARDVSSVTLRDPVTQRWLREQLKP